MLINLVHNIALLIALSTFYGLFLQKLQSREKAFRITIGVWFGLVTIAGMLTPFNYAEGIFFDGRSVILALSGLFGGWIPALISAAIAGSFRIMIGGAGVYAGVSTIILCSVTGVLFRHHFKNEVYKLTLLQYLFIGFVAHVAMLGSQLFFPWPQGIEIIQQIWQPVLLVFPATFMLIGALLGREEKRIIGNKKLSFSEKRFRTTLYSIGDAVITTDKRGNITLMNTIAEQLTGYTEREAIGKALEKVFVIINEHSRNKVESPVDKVFESGTIVGLANHTLLVSKNGDEIPIADSGAPIEDAEGQIVGVVLVFRDQIEQHRQQSLLEESESKYRELVETTDVIAWEYDIIHDAFLYMAPQVTDKTGWRPEEWTNLAFWRQNIHPADRERINNLMDTCTRENPRLTLEYQFKKKTGGYLWLRDLVILEVVKDKPAKLRGIMLDISTLKKTEQELQTSRSNLVALINNRNESIWSIDNEYRLVVCNDYFRASYEAAYDFKLEFGIDLVSILKPDLKAFWKAHYDTALQGHKVAFEFSETIHNKKHHFNVWLNPIYIDNHIAGASALSVDMTELVEVRENLKLSEEKFRRLFERHSAVHFLLDPETGRIENVNQAAADFYGWTIEELKKMNIHEINTMEKQALADTLKKAGTTKNNRFEVKHRLANGQIRDVEIYSSKVEIFGKAYLHSIVHDITDKQLLLKELLTAKEKAEENDRLKSAFLANMSHEIRTPLNGILGFTGLITGEDLPPKSRRMEYSAIINRSAESLMQLVNDILEISKLDAGQYTIETREFNLFDTLKSLHTLYQKKLEDVNKIKIQLTVAINDKNLFMTGDETRLTQIFTNLLDNALKFTNEGQISYGIKEMNAEKIIFFVSDTGIGIEKRNQDIIFERFSQADETISRNFGGTGLGLSIVKKTVELMDGQITVESEHGKGSLFEIHLPNTTRTVLNNQVEMKEKNTSVTKKIKILLVEDDPISRMYYEAILKDDLIELLIAGTGTLAIELATKEKPDVILLDIRLPDISGLDVARNMRNSGSKVRIIAQSAFAMPGDEQAALEAGCNDYLTKPVKANLLLEKLKAII
jgi:PAS domain S-box-containing protein